MIEARIGENFETTFTAGQTGLTPQFRVDDNQGATVIGPTASGVIELGTSGVYSATVAAPGTAGQWTIIWSPDGTFDPATNASDDLVTFDAAVPTPPTPPLSPISADGADSVGPCQAWTDSDSTALCCALDSSDTSVLDDSVVAASQVLYALVPRFSGTCGPIRVRPCGSPCGGGSWLGWGWGNGNGWVAPVGISPLFYGGYEPIPPSRGCGCQALSRVKLAGRVREVTEVTIDGAIIDPATYRVDDNEWLTRLPDPADLDTRLFWPSCQDMEQAESEVGTFSVLYTYGVDPPVAGQMAARELACAIYTTCQLDSGANDDSCPLPNNVTKVQRQGITVDLKAFTGWGFSTANGQWQTGMPLVDMFLNAYNPHGRRRRRARAWSPDMMRPARRLGV